MNLMYTAKVTTVVKKHSNLLKRLLISTFMLWIMFMIISIKSKINDVENKINDVDKHVDSLVLEINGGPTGWWGPGKPSIREILEDIDEKFIY